MPTFDHEPAATAVTRLLDGITDDQLTGPTPCPQMSVAALLDHLMGLCLAFTWAARKSTAEEAGSNPPGSGTAGAEHLDPDWRSQLPKRLQDLVEAWHDPAAWPGLTEAGGLALPGEVAAMVALDEVVLHGWDLARATGQPYPVDPVSTGVVLEFVTESARPDQAPMREGLFGPVVPVPDDAPAFDRALGLAGRDPAWSVPSDVVRRLMDAYLAQDRPATEQLVAADFVFTSPQDDHLDRATWFDVCFPTAGRTRRQEIQRLAVTGDDAFVMYEYELLNGEVYRNAELITVRGGRAVQTQVFFGGRYDRPK